MPATDAPDGIISGELITDVGVAVAGVETIRNSRRREYEEDSLVVKSGLHAEVTAPANAQAIEPVGEVLLVAGRAAPGKSS